MRGSSKFEVRSSKQIRNSKKQFLSVGKRENGLVPSSPLPSPPVEEREKAARQIIRFEPGLTICARIRLLKSASTKARKFGIRGLNLVRVSSFDFRLFTPCK
jgi:hypothetical protein